MAAAKRARKRGELELERTIELPRAEAARALDHVTAQIRRLAKDERRARYAIATKLRHVEALELHRARDYPSVIAYGSDVLEIPEDWVAQSLRVASAFSEETVVAFGFEKLDRGLRYIAATPEDEAPEDVPSLVLRVPSADGAGVREVPFESASLSELKQAVAGAKRAPGEGVGLAPGVRRAIVAADRALDGAVAPIERDAASVRSRRDGAGDVLLDVEGVPWERAEVAFAAVAAALRAAKRGASSTRRPSGRTAKERATSAPTKRRSKRSASTKKASNGAPRNRPRAKSRGASTRGR